MQDGRRRGGCRKNCSVIITSILLSLSEIFYQANAERKQLMLGKKSYKDYTASHAPASHMAGNCARAFLFGGGICVFAQALCALYSMLGASEENARLCSTFTLIVLAALLTALDVFDTIAEHAGAGTLVPITGFSNAISAEAISARSEGFITGIGNKIFTIAGPVILYGTAASVLYGIIYYIVGMFM